MTGPVSTPDPAADLRTRIADAFAKLDARDWGYDHGFVAYGSDTESDAFVDAAAAEIHSELAGLRETEENLRDLIVGWVRYGDRKKAERREQSDALRAALGLADGDRTRHIPHLIERVAHLRAEHSQMASDRADAVRGYECEKQLREGYQREVDGLNELLSAARAEVARLVSGSTPTIPDDAEEQIAYRIADYWTLINGDAGPDDSDYGIAHHVLDLVLGWGSAVANPTDGEAGDVVRAAADALAEVKLSIGPNTRSLIADGSWRQMHLSVGERHDIALVLQQAGLLASPAPAAGVVDTLPCGHTEAEAQTSIRHELCVDTRTPDEVAEDDEDFEHNATFRPVLDIVPPPTTPVVECKAIEGGMGVDCHLAAGHDGWHDAHHTPRTDGTESIGYPFDIQWPRNEHDRCALPTPSQERTETDA